MKQKILPFAFALFAALPVAVFAAPQKLVLHLDMKAGMMQRENLVGLLRDAAKDGYNAVLWEIEDKVRFDMCPDVAYSEAYSKDDFKGILAEAEKLGLEPIPLLQTFGHAEYVLSHEKYFPLREKADDPTCYCVQKPEVRTFLAKLLSEYLDLFGPAVKEFHLGGDEARVFGTCPQCAARKKGELYAEHLAFLSDILKTRGVKPGIWCDMVLAELDDEAATLVPPEYTIWHWDYVVGNGNQKCKWTPKLDLLLKRGYDVIFCGASQSAGDDPFLVRYGYSAKNLAYCADYVRTHGLKGLCVTSWSVRAAPKAMQRPLFAFAAKRFLRPDPNVTNDLRSAVSAAFGASVPLASVLLATEGDYRANVFDLRDRLRHFAPTAPLPGRPKRIPDKTATDAAQKLADKAASALAALKAVPAAETTPLFADFLSGLELKRRFFAGCARWNDARPDPADLPTAADVSAYYQTEETAASAAVSARVVLRRLLERQGRASVTESDAWPVRDEREVRSLDGTWDFALNGRSGQIAVPGNWETQGWSAPHYASSAPALTGVYERVFAPEPRRSGRRTILRLDGVLFNYDVELNGRSVARDVGGAFLPHQFDVTDFLRADAPNRIRIVVRTRGRGWLWDTNDCWCLCGIQRSVSLFSVPEAHLKDVVFRSDVRDDGDVDVTVAVETSGAAAVRVRLLDGNDVVFSAATNGPDAVLSGRLRRPKLWTAETPNLYALETVLTDAQGATLQSVVERVGLKTVRARPDGLTVNGRKVFLHGACFNEIDPREGRALSRETFRRQLLQMKEANVNTIRTAHYPFAPVFYDLCDEMGFYVIDEVPMGSRGKAALGDPSYLPDMLERAARTVRRDRNRASVTVWTVGNENPVTTNIHEVLAFLSQADPTRPKSLPQIGSHFIREYMAVPDENQELQTAHYLRFDYLRRAAAGARRPLVQTEFGHSLGDSSDGFQDEYVFMRQTPRFAGGCVWLWRDQAVLTDGRMDGFSTNGVVDGSTPRIVPPEFEGVWKDATHFLDSYGSYGSDGIVYADNTPKEMFHLVRKLYSPIQVTLDGGVLTVTNEYDFLSLDGCRLVWRDIDLDRVVRTDEARLSAPSHGSERLELGALKGTHLSVAVADRSGRTVWEEGFRLRDPQQPPQTGAVALDGSQFLLRVGRRAGLTSSFRTIRAKKNPCVYWQPHLLRPESVKKTVQDGVSVYSLTWKGFAGEVRLSSDGTVAYSVRALPETRGDFPELGLALDLGTSPVQVEWFGRGPWTATPLKWMMSSFGLWSLGKTDLRFDGSRLDTSWALARDSSGDGVAVAATDGVAPFGFENVDGRVVVTHLAKLSSYGTKSRNEDRLVSVRDEAAARALTFGGSFRIWRSHSDRPLARPFEPFVRHYGK